MLVMTAHTAPKEIAEAEGVDPEDVVLWKYDGMRSIPKYKIS